MSSTTRTETSSTTQRRSSTSSTSSLPKPLQDLVDEAENEREVYEDSWSRLPRSLRVVIRPSKSTSQPQQTQRQVNTKKSLLAARKPHLPASLQHLVDKEEKEAGLYEDSWARLPRPFGFVKFNRKSETKS